jgi:hypothetical protein
MNNDLISRDALKADFKERNIWSKDIVDAIDNAPTVFSCNACKNMGNERECVDCHDYSNYVHYNERPQGEWIDLDTDESWYRFKCSNCLTLFSRGMFMKGYPYCPKCGAEMQHD